MHSDLCANYTSSCFCNCSVEPHGQRAAGVSPSATKPAGHSCPYCLLVHPLRCLTERLLLQRSTLSELEGFFPPPCLPKIPWSESLFRWRVSLCLLISRSTAQRGLVVCVCMRVCVRVRACSQVLFDILFHTTAQELWRSTTYGHEVKHAFPQFSSCVSLSKSAANAGWCRRCLSAAAVAAASKWIKRVSFGVNMLLLQHWLSVTLRWTLKGTWHGNLCWIAVKQWMVKCVKTWFGRNSNI